MAGEGVPPRADETPPQEVAAAPPPPEKEEDWETRFKYLFADFENFRRRVSKEREVQRLQVHAGLLSRLLPLYEAAHRAREAVGKLPASDPVRRGVELLAHEWGALLEAEGVTPVAAVGAPFEADRHEAVAEAPPSAEVPSGSVAEIVQQGYRMGSTLLRPAKVVVARAPPASSSAAAMPEGASDLDASDE